MKTVKSETWELRMRKLLVQAMCILLFILALCSAAPISFAQDGLQETDDALSAEEMLNLGLSYYNGDGVQQNYSTAQKWFEKSAEEGSAEAAFYLGQMYFEGNGVKRSYGQAREWFIKAADAGNTDAMRMLGYFYLAGVGVVPSEAEGTAFYEKAIALGDPEAIAQYGSILFQGYGCVARDEVKAKEFLENAGNEALSCGNADVLLAVARVYGYYATDWSCNERFLYWEEQAADLGSVDAMMYLADAYRGFYGIPQNLAKVIEFTERAAETGHTPAMKMLGDWYENGENGLRKDLNKAVYWYSRCLETDETDPTVMCFLADIYRSAEYTEKNYGEALRLYEQALEIGDNIEQFMALRALSEMYEKGQGVEADPAKAMELTQQADTILQNLG